jgi:hypothetical protein
VLFWFAGTALVAVWLVFRDPAFDHRLVVVGALLPDLVDLPVGAGPAHSLAAPVVVLVAVMLTTRGRRVRRRSLLAVPIGWFLHLVFDGAFRLTEVFWWPWSGGFGDHPLPAVSRGAWNLVLEAVGVVMLAWAWRTFGLADPDQRAAFWRTGRVSKSIRG